MNLAVLKPSRKGPRDGDIFALLPPAGGYLFGRVISNSAKAGWSMTGAILVYVYAARSADKREVPELDVRALLVPPMMTNRLPWSKGYFETVANRPLLKSDILTGHCFVDVSGRYFDDQNNELPGPVGLVGIRGLHSFRTIDDEVSKALGIPLAPDTQDSPD